MTIKNKEQAEGWSWKYKWPMWSGPPQSTQSIYQKTRRPQSIGRGGLPLPSLAVANFMTLLTR